MRSTATRMTARSVPGGISTSGKSTASGASTSPRPWRRTIRGGPSNEQSITTMRPFSRRCAMVSAPLPITSRYATVCGSRMRRLSIGPFGDTLTWPSAPLGAVPTKNMRWRPIQAASLPSMPGKTLPIAPILRVGQHVPRHGLRLAAGDVEHLDAGQLAHPGELPLGVVARAPLNRLDVAGEQLVEAERLARGVRGAGRVGGADLVERAGADHLVDTGVDARIERLALHHEPDEPSRVPGLCRPQLVRAVGRLELAELVQLERADDPAAVVRADALRRPRRAPRELRVQGLGSAALELDLEARAHLGRRRRAQRQVGQGG